MHFLSLSFPAALIHLMYCRIDHTFHFNHLPLPSRVILSHFLFVYSFFFHFIACYAFSTYSSCTLAPLALLLPRVLLFFFFPFTSSTLPLVFALCASPCSTRVTHFSSSPLLVYFSSHRRPHLHPYTCMLMIQ